MNVKITHILRAKSESVHAPQPAKQSMKFIPGALDGTGPVQYIDQDDIGLVKKWDDLSVYIINQLYCINGRRQLSKLWKDEEKKGKQ